MDVYGKQQSGRGSLLRSNAQICWFLGLSIIIIGTAMGTIASLHLYSDPQDFERPVLDTAPGITVSDYSPLANGRHLRILNLGASIVYGLRSSDENGYRSVLRNTILSVDNTVNMVGSRQSGTMEDNYVEGWPGAFITDVEDKAAAFAPGARPNVILLNAGTNDCVFERDVDEAGLRMGAMLDNLFTWCPGTTIVLSSLLVNRRPETQKNIELVNIQYRELAEKRRSEGQRIVFADMNTDTGPVVDDLADETHPKDGGYRKMAAAWFLALVEASEAGFIQDVEDA